MAREIVLAAAVSGAVIMPIGHVACERHIPTYHLQELEALGRIMQPLGRPQAAPSHPLVFFTRRHWRRLGSMSDFIVKMHL